MSTVSLERKRTFWAWASGTFFGIGLVGKGGGTVASAVTALLWWAIAREVPAPQLLWITPLAALIATAHGVLAASIVAEECGKKDPSEVVLDEVAGQLIAFVCAPGAGWKYVLAGLILFRSFDILKPPPVRQLERLPAGWGIMMDDVAAGLLALLVLQAVHYFGWL